MQEAIRTVPVSQDTTNPVQIKKKIRPYAVKYLYYYQRSTKNNLSTARALIDIRTFVNIAKQPLDVNKKIQPMIL